MAKCGRKFIAKAHPLPNTHKHSLAQFYYRRGGGPGFETVLNMYTHSFLQLFSPSNTLRRVVNYNRLSGRKSRSLESFLTPLLSRPGCRDLFEFYCYWPYWYCLCFSGNLSLDYFLFTFEQIDRISRNFQSWPDHYTNIISSSSDRISAAQ